MLISDGSPITKTTTTAARAASARTMPALVQPAYGDPDVLRVDEVALPALGPDQVLVRVRAASVCKGDVHLLTGKPYLVRLAFGLRRPKHRVAGQNLAGTVEAVGAAVRSLAPGDAVYGQAFGAFAGFVVAPEDALAKQPKGLTHEEAATLPVSGVTALQSLRDGGKVRAGQAVLINGASGGVGTFAVQIAKALGAEVTAVCSTRHVEKVRSLGADHVIDYTREDFVESGKRHDVMIDFVGNRSFAECRRVLTPQGTFVASAGSPGDNWLGPIVYMLKLKLAGLFATQRFTSILAWARRADLLALNDLVEKGALAPVIERRYPLADAAEAVRHVATGHAQGQTVITF